MPDEDKVETYFREFEEWLDEVDLELPEAVDLLDKLQKLVEYRITEVKRWG